MIKIICSGCGKIRFRPASRVTIHDYYLCLACDRKGDYLHPLEPTGQIRIIDPFAAKGFIGFTTRFPTAQEQALITQAEALRKAGSKRKK
ncbi:MAG: hypothetical protein AB1489_18575 [Acidobacteriota bacterium]